MQITFNDFLLKVFSLLKISWMNLLLEGDKCVCVRSRVWRVSDTPLLYLLRTDLVYLIFLLTRKRQEYQKKYSNPKNKTYLQMHSVVTSCGKLFLNNSTVANRQLEVLPLSASVSLASLFLCWKLTIYSAYHYVELNKRDNVF